ncbi:MAG: NAD-dependent epimerase/dehydratase family protein, partial [Gammaproteobacteria bacterium]|nr:NAD-dependent epimerase/dehydratase family protein [Gammaproteobacteria bacterium]
EVVIIDNLSRRKIDVELEVESLTPISHMSTRLAAWKEVSGNQIEFISLDIAVEYDRFAQLLRDTKPDGIVHFAEQRAAPYSMKSPNHKRYTVDNNISATHNLLCAVVDSGLDIHLVHLGTMGVYGYKDYGAVIPEGYLEVEIKLPGGDKIEQTILHPADPGSVYHMTKTLDQLLFYFYNKNDRVRITDLHQGVVWGTNTEETSRDERLINRFDYDGDYGTVLNRFLIQAAIDFPLTVHGTGGQTRAFIHIQDTVRCVTLALENPPDHGSPVQIFNQLTETHRVRDLANLVSELTGVEIQNIENPRNEAAENELTVDNKCLLDLGLQPTKLAEGLITEVIDISKKYAHRCDKSKILSRSRWIQHKKS